MKALLICPTDRGNFNLVTELSPLATIPLLGQSLLEYWLSYLALSGVKDVSILASDRPELTAKIIGNGARWGINAGVISETRELTPAQALLKYEDRLNPAPMPNGVTVLDHFPALAQHSLFSNYRDWFTALLAWMPRASTPDRVGVRELQPGVWVDLHAHISKKAQLRAPCWIGKKVLVGDCAVVGPNAVLEDRSFVEPGVEVSNSVIGPDTFVGRYSEIRSSVAWGSTLINWKNGSAARVPDPFLLCSLRRPVSGDTQGWFARLADLYSRNKADAQLVWKHFLMNKEG